MVTSPVSSCQHEDEPPQDLRPGASGERSLSKSALKNQRKREAKKAAKQVRHTGAAGEAMHHLLSSCISCYTNTTHPVPFSN